MSPREKHLAILSALGAVTFAFYYIPTFVYATIILAVCCFACYYHSGEPLFARLGLNPRAGLAAPAVLRRWLGGWGVTGVSVATQERSRSSRNKTEFRESEGHFKERIGEAGIYRKETLESDSFLFSPRDFLMGSYIGKPESPTAAAGRPRAGRNPREQLREKLSRPNHAVYTPNRRLSFAREPLGTIGRFTITPQRHYPLQQPGVSSVGVLPPVKWDGFSKKSILSPRNSPAVLSPVTVKIAAPADPCSRESVLKVLKESRKREVQDEDRSFTTEQRSKRRNDSGGSAHSAFGPLLLNGTPSQLVPPGNLKRGMTSLMEESTMKRSRTSSISSGSGVHAPRGTQGTIRNPIHSSYSSREEDAQSPSSASSARSDQVASKLTPVHKAPVPTTTDSPGSGGKRKRKIQLVSSHRDDQISLPPPPELGYAITAKDLDEEKMAAIGKIQKVLEAPSAFTQVLAQVSKASSNTSAAPAAGPALFGLASQISTPAASSNSVTSAAPPASTSGSVWSSNPLLVSGFKPIFAVTMTTTSSTPTSESKPSVQNFRPIFGSATAGTAFGQPPSLTTTSQPASTASSSITSSMFGSTRSSTVAPSVFPGMTSTPTSTTSTGSISTSQTAAQPALKSLFGNWSTPTTTSTSSATAQAPNTGSTFQFGTATTTTTAAAAAPAAATTTSGKCSFTFGAALPDAQAANQKVFTFGQAAPSQKTTTASFGGFSMAGTASTTATATTQLNFAFGKPSFQAQPAQATFGTSAAPTPNPFNFGGSGASSTPASNPTPPAFAFGAGAATTATSFGTLTKPAFGASSTGFAFGGTSAPSAAPSFGASAQTQSSASGTFTFGGATPQPAPAGPTQPAPSGFPFTAAVPQFGTPVSNNPAPQMGSFNFGAAATDKPAFGTSTPSFGQSVAAGPIPFGSPGTPGQGFNAVPF
uniref:Uncharacterized protein n=1 Tax=Mola mola TaxID=94237 RepID=A0A3Q3X2T0_MOLML